MSNMLYRPLAAAAASGAAVLIPVLPIDERGQMRQADGRQLLDLPAASALLDRLNPADAPHEAKLYEAYEQFVVDCFGRDGAQRIAAEDPAHPAPAAAPMREDLSARALHRLKFPDLPWEYFADLLAECRERGLDPWSRHVWAELRYDPKVRRKVLFVGVTIDGLRFKAQSTGLYRGQTAPQFCGDDGVWVDVWTAKGPPHGAQVGVYRADRSEPIYKAAYWRECAVYHEREQGPCVLDPVWQQRPCHMLAKVAEAFALRAALPDACRGLYTREEMGAPSPQSRGGESTTATEEQEPQRPVPGRASQPSAAGDSLTVEGQMTQFQFELALVDLGFGKPDARNRLIERFKAEQPQLYRDDRPAFYRHVLDTVAQSDVARKID